MSRQGHGYATAEEARVIFRPKDDADEEIKDVPKDGKTVGEIVTRGNIVMKEVRFRCCRLAHADLMRSTSMILQPQKKRSRAVFSIQATWRS